MSQPNDRGICGAPAPTLGFSTPPVTCNLLAEHPGWHGDRVGMSWAERSDPPTELLTEADHRALSLTVELWNVLCRDVVGAGRSRAGDLGELCGHIHAIQHAVLSQAAARAYPDLYRLLGGELTEPPGGQP